MQQIPFTIENYRPAKAGALKGSFTLVLQPGDLELRDCKYFMLDTGKEWINLPQREKKNEDTKTTYFPLNKFKNVNYWDALMKQVIEQIKTKFRKNTDGQNTNENLVQGDAQPVWF